MRNLYRGKMEVLSKLQNVYLIFKPSQTNVCLGRVVPDFLPIDIYIFEFPDLEAPYPRHGMCTYFSRLPALCAA